jgi:hypothetical protein
MFGGGSSSRMGVGRKRGKGEKKGRSDFYDEPLFEFPLESKSDFNCECPLRGYDSYKEDWPRCRHGLDCVVQMCTDENDGAGRLFFICLKGQVLLLAYLFCQIFIMLYQFL